METLKSFLKLVAISAVSTAKDGRNYYTAEFQDPENPFAQTRKRNFFQQFNPTTNLAEWRGADPSTVKQWIGKQIPGYIANREVEPYVVPGRPGQPDRTVNFFTTVVMGHEQEAVIFRTQRHPLADGTSLPSIPQPAGRPNIHVEQGLPAGPEDLALVDEDAVNEMREERDAANAEAQPKVDDAVKEAPKK